MSNVEYMLDGQYLLYVVIVLQEAENTMIEIRLDQLLTKQRRTFYWLAKETGISHTTLWRLKKDKALGINFETLEKICGALKCNPGDVLVMGPDGAGRRSRNSKKRSAAKVNGR